VGANPAVGVLYHWIGGLAAASFYLPYRGVRRWSWETYWLVGGVFSWIVAPLVLAWALVPGLWEALHATPARTLWWAYAFGVLWGIGGLTFGLAVRYLGIALGVAVALGYCAAFGTLVPPIVSGDIVTIAASTSGRVILAGVAACLVGIALSGMAGMRKERELSQEEKAATVREFSFSRGMLVATFSGIMSSCFAYGLAAGKPLAEIARGQLVAAGRSDLWENLPVLVVVLLGGFTTNFLWCVALNVRNGSLHEYLGLGASAAAAHRARNGEPQSLGAAAAPAHAAAAGIPLVRNYLLSAAAGITWYFQFFFYSMGQTRMGPYEFSSWTLHMASIIIFSTLWGVALKEWRGTSARTHLLIGAGLAVLIGSTVVVGYGNFLKSGQ
jgi:L-rhamnose-H+ transport protein